MSDRISRMTDSIVWVDLHTAVNLNAVAYVRFGSADAKIVFSTGEVITLEGKDSERFAQYLRQTFKEAKWSEPDPQARSL